MSNSSLPIAAVCFLLYLVEVLSGPYLMPPLELSRPVCTKYTGKATFLTFQTNCIGTVFFFINLLHVLGVVNAHSLLVHAFPLIFALSTFLTLAYVVFFNFVVVQACFADLTGRRIIFIEIYMVVCGFFFAVAVDTTRWIILILPTGRGVTSGKLKAGSYS